MEEERIPKNGFKRKLLHHMTSGRPRTKWADVVESDALQLVGIRGWRRRAENRDEWRRLMREAKVRKGLERIIWMDVAEYCCSAEEATIAVSFMYVYIYIL